MKKTSKYFLFSLLVFFFCFIFSFNFVLAQTDIQWGNISEDTVWTKEGSPYVIYSPSDCSVVLTIDTGVTLTIEAGTVVKFDYCQSINVLGKLITKGTSDEKVYFTSVADPVGGITDIYGESYEPWVGDWDGLMVDGGSIELNDSVISYVNTSLYANLATVSFDGVDIKECEDGILGEESSIDIKNSSLKNVWNDAIVLNSNSTANLDNFYIDSVDGDGISVLNNSVLNISNSDIKNISGDFLFLNSDTSSSIKSSIINKVEGDGISILDNSVLSLEDVNIENIVGDFLYLNSNSTSVIKSSTIDTVEGDGFGVYNNSSLNFENSSIKSISGQVLYMYGDSNVDMEDSNIENSDDGIIFFNNSTLSMADSNILNVTGSPFFEYYQGSHLSLSSSTLQNISGTAIGCYGTSWDGYGTTTLDISSSTISDGDDIGLQLSGDKLEVNILKSKIQNFASDGIQTYGYSWILITDSEISGNNNGIVSWGTNLEIKNSSILGNKNYGISNNPAPNYPKIIATNNWWGDALGPFYRANPRDKSASSTPNQVSWNIEYDPWLLDLPGAKAKCCSNVLFLPGLEASRLYKNGNDGQEDRLWEPEVFHDNSLLYLDVDGVPKNYNIYTKDIIDNAYLPIKGNIYESFISLMNKMKSEEVINDWKAVPYDWRLSLEDLLNDGKEYSGGKIYYAGELASTSDPYILSELRRLASSSATGKVTIIGHSNGGLLTKALTDKLGAEASKLIDKIIFVAVPQAGTPTAVGALLHGFQQGLPKDWLPLFISPTESRELGKNMSSAYNLLPSSQYFNYVSDPVITFDDPTLLTSWRAKYGDIINSGASLYNFLVDQSREILPTKSDLVSLPTLNKYLLDSANELHDTKLDNWTVPEGISLTEIAGWGEDTLSGIEYYEGKMTSCTDPQDIYTCDDVSSLEYRPKITYDGDGTVVVPSALWTASSTAVNKYWVDLQDYDTFTTLERKHADILEVPELRSFIQNIIIQSTSTLPDYISTSTPTSDDLEKHLRFILHSPLSLDLYDDEGNHTGFSTTTNELEENIPGSRYITFGEVKYISVPASSTIYLFMQGYSSGSFTLDIEQVQGNIVTASTTFAGIPSSTSTIVTINIPNGNIASTSPLIVDINGDGKAEINLVQKPGEVVVPDFSKKQSSSPRHRKVSSVATSSEVFANDNNISTTTVVFASGTKQSSIENGGLKNGGLTLGIKKGESSVFTELPNIITATKNKIIEPKNGGLALKRNEVTGKGESSVFKNDLVATVGTIPVDNGVIHQIISATYVFIKKLVSKIIFWH